MCTGNPSPLTSIFLFDTTLPTTHLTFLICPCTQIPTRALSLFYLFHPVDALHAFRPSYSVIYSVINEALEKQSFVWLTNMEKTEQSRGTTTFFLQARTSLPRRISPFFPPSFPSPLSCLFFTWGSAATWAAWLRISNNLKWSHCYHRETPSYSQLRMMVSANSSRPGMLCWRNWNCWSSGLHN